MRLFFALWPPRKAAEAMHAWARRVHRVTGGSVVPAANIHLTLAFLGNVEGQRVAELKSLPVESRPPALRIERACYWARNRIVWAGPHETPVSLGILVDDLKNALMKTELMIERRPFAAHVTLIRKARKPELLPPLPAVSWPIEAFVLMRSELSAGGARYEVVKRYSFG